MVSGFPTHSLPKSFTQQTNIFPTRVKSQNHQPLTGKSSCTFYYTRIWFYGPSEFVTGFFPHIFWSRSEIKMKLKSETFHYPVKNVTWMFSCLFYGSLVKNETKSDGNPIISLENAVEIPWLELVQNPCHDPAWKTNKSWINDME